MENSSNQDSHLRKPNVPKVRQFPLKRTVRGHTTAKCPGCAPIRLLHQRPSCFTPRPYAHTARKRKIWWKTRFRCYLRFTAQRTWNQHRLPRDPIVSKVTHYPQIRVSITNALLCLEHCSVFFSLSYGALYFRLNTHYESKASAK